MCIDSKYQQITNTILMVRPLNFGFNPETAVNNTFQRDNKDLDHHSISSLAQLEFDEMVKSLRLKGVTVEVIDDTNDPIKTDAVFPNNWITFHENDEVFTFPMFSPNRRNEVRIDLIQNLMENYSIKKIHQFHPLADEGLYLEGTGSMILDRKDRLVYACLSDRTNVNLLHKFCEIAKYSPVEFHAYSEDGVPIYHTNVMMALGLDFAIICLDCIENNDRQKVVNYLRESKKDIISISLEQMKQFAGNMLQVKMKNGFPLLVMSQSAYESLNESQLDRLREKTEIISVSIPTIEYYGGGSVRCMMAEIFCHSK
jgi:hypothetical protein